MKLFNQVKLRAFERRNKLYVPRVEADTKRASWPTCGECHRDVESVEVKDVHKERVVIVVACHGKEEAVKIDFPYSVLKRTDEETWEHVHTAIKNFQPFSGET